MTARRTILYPTDFSKASRPAFTTAIDLARATGATLTVLHVIVPIVPLVPEQFLDTPTWTRIDRQAREWGFARLHQLAARARGRGVHVTTVLCEGDPSRHIVATARAVRAAFVVMGTHGRRGISRFLLGSVAERVVALAPCPVVTTRISAPVRRSAARRPPAALRARKPRSHRAAGPRRRKASRAPQRRARAGS